MNKRILAPLAGAMLCGFSAFATSPIIPAPKSLTAGNGTFKFAPVENVAVPDYAGDSVARTFTTLQEKLEQASGAKLTASKSGRIAMKVNPSLQADGYTLDVTADSIVIQASRPVGFFYGLQTLRQILPVASENPATVEVMSIEDSPRFGWRGFMLDEGRHMFGKDAVKRVLDVMALYKLNRFHWHLTEDQGWRLEIKAYPKLTREGALRAGTTLAYQNVPTDSIPYGGFYTQDDIKEIVAYAADRFIDVVPEIDLPGHTQAAIAAYPEILACDPENPHEVWAHAGVTADVMNVANPAAVKFTKDVLDEVAELFPFQYLHLGGDECPTKKWEENAECQALLKKIGSENYRDLQLNFYKELREHMAKRPADKQPKLIFWNEVLHGNTDLIGNDIVVMSWVDWERAAQDAASRGMEVIMTPIIPYYINRKQAELPGEPHAAGKGTETLEAVYNYEPLGQADPSKTDQYLGIQGNFWTEWVNNEAYLQYLMLPRLAAIAETGWSPKEAHNYTDFVNRLKEWHAPYYYSEGLNYCKHALK